MNDKVSCTGGAIGSWLVMTLAVLLGILTLSAAPGAQAASGKAQIVILDATNSMWGRIKGGRKITTAREAIAVAGSRARAALFGVYVIGRRPRQRCEDIDVAVPLSPVSPQALRAAMRRITPGRGRMPLMAAIERAAAALTALAGKGEIILIVDGADNCADNACATARTFHAQNPNIGVNIISLARSKKTDADLECMARAFDGSYQKVASDDALAKAVGQMLSGNAPRLARRRSAGEASLPGGPPVPERNPVRSGLGAEEPNLILRAVLAPGTAPLTDGLAWRVLAGRPSGGQTPKVLWRGADPEPAIRLPAGRYYLEVTYGLSQARRDFEVGSDDVREVTVNLNAGMLKLSSVAVPGGQPQGDVFYYLYAVDESGANAAQIGRSSRMQPTFIVPAGKYRIVAQYPYGEAEDTISIAAGQIVGKSLVLNTGKLRLSARLSNGGPPPEGVFYYVYRRMSGADGGEKEIGRSALPEPEFMLPAGRYRVVAKLDTASEEAVVQIAAGEEVAEQLVLNVGTLHVASKLAGQQQPLARDVVYRVYRKDGGASLGKEVAVSARSELELSLEAGRYRIVSTYGRGNAVEVGEATIEPGKSQSLTLIHNAGQVQIALVRKKGGLPLGRVKWSIRDAQGKEVLSSTEPRLDLTLRTGQYVAVAERGGEVNRQAFTVHANESAVVEVVAK